MQRMGGNEGREGGAAPGVEALDRGLRVLEALAAAGPQGVQLGELTTVLDANKSTVHRALGVLRARDYAVQDPVTGAYRLGPRLVRLADDHLAQENLPALLDPALKRINHEVDELVHLGILNLPWVVYAAKVEPAHPVRVFSRVGARGAAATTALGRAILAALPAVPYADLRGTGKALDKERVAAAVDAARRLGYAAEWEENEAGIACVGVAILRHGVPCAAVSVTAPVDRLDSDRAAVIGETVRRVLSRSLPEGLTLPDPA
jgi:DNA-binding IclR family transcriptional regulator